MSLATVTDKARHQQHENEHKMHRITICSPHSTVISSQLRCERCSARPATFFSCGSNPSVVPQRNFQNLSLRYIIFVAHPIHHPISPSSPSRPQQLNDPPFLPPVILRTVVNSELLPPPPRSYNVGNNTTVKSFFEDFRRRRCQVCRIAASVSHPLPFRPNAGDLVSKITRSKRARR